MTDTNPKNSLRNRRIVDALSWVALVAGPLLVIGYLAVKNPKITESLLQFYQIAFGVLFEAAAWFASQPLLLAQIALITIVPFVAVRYLGRRLFRSNSLE